MDGLLTAVVAGALALGSALALGDLTDGAAPRGGSACGDYLKGTRGEQEALCRQITAADDGSARTHETFTHDTDTGE